MTHKLPEELETGARPAPRTGWVRNATAEELRGLAGIHQAAFRDAFLAQLGKPFLVEYYRLVATYDGGILLVEDGGEGARGLVAGFMEPGRFYARMLSHKWRLVWPVIPGLLKSPRLLGRVLSGLRFVRKSSSSSVNGSVCELSSIAVHPDATNQGVGKRLLDTFLEAAWSKGADCVYLTTDADNLAANILYKRHGFELIQTFHRGRNREMHEYAYFRH